MTWRPPLLSPPRTTARGPGGRGGSHREKESTAAPWTVTLTARAAATALLAPPLQARHDAAALTEPALVEPRIQRSECTQINVTKTIKITYDPDPNADTPF